MAEGAEDVFAKEESNNRLFWRSIAHIIERRREQQRQFQRVLDATPDAILVVNDEGVMLYVNQSAVDLFGRSREDLLGESLGFSVADNVPAEIHIARADGERVCEMRIVRMEWNDERAYLASVRDITERKRAEALQARSVELEFENRRIQEASRLKSAFLANMSHELRTPLNAIIGFSELLYDGMISPSSPQYRTFIGHIQSSGKHLLQLINDVLDLSKVEAGKVVFTPRAGGPGPARFRSLRQPGRTGGAEAPAAASMDHDESLVDVQLDPGRFKQILYNYLSNALKFSPDEGVVHIRTRSEVGGMFRLDVRDQGPGISLAIRPPVQGIPAAGSRRQQAPWRHGLGAGTDQAPGGGAGRQRGCEEHVGQGSEFFAVLPRRPPEPLND
jgi:signal transduction histidine kinase